MKKLILILSYCSIGKSYGCTGFCF